MLHTTTAEDNGGTNVEQAGTPGRTPAEPIKHIPYNNCRASGYWSEMHTDQQQEKIKTVFNPAYK